MARGAIIHRLKTLFWLHALIAPACAACITVEGDRILARDLSGAVPAFAALQPGEDFGYAPAAGARRLVGPLELRRWAARHRLDLESSDAKPPDICFERALNLLDGERVREAVAAAVADPTVHIEVIDYSRYAIPAGQLDFPRSGLNASAGTGVNAAVIWRGRLRYGGDRSVPVWVKVRLTVERTWVEAAVPLVVARPIDAAQLRLRTGNQFPYAPQGAAAVEDVVGKLPKRSFRAGEPVQASLLALPKEVERGDAVDVTVESGALELRFTGAAQTSGRIGETVFVRNPQNGKQVSGTVQGPGKVLMAAGPQTQSPPRARRSPSAAPETKGK